MLIMLSGGSAPISMEPVGHGRVMEMGKMDGVILIIMGRMDGITQIMDKTDITAKVDIMGKVAGMEMVKLIHGKVNGSHRGDLRVHGNNGSKINRIKVAQMMLTLCGQNGLICKIQQEHGSHLMELGSQLLEHS